MVYIFEWFFSQSIEVRVNIISTISAAVISIISLLIALASLIQNGKVIKEANRPNVVIFLHSTTIGKFIDKYLVIKNFGNTPAKIDKIICSRKIDFCNNLNPFNDLKNFTIAPTQSIVTECNFDNCSEPFEFEIHYSNGRRKFKEFCYINPHIIKNLSYSYKISSEKNDIKDIILNSTNSIIKSKI